jgi:hypothetical protein
MGFQVADDPRDQRLEIRVTPAEKLKIQNDAAAHGCSVSRFVLQRALQRPGFSRGEKVALRQLSEILEALQYLTTHHGDRSVDQLGRILSGIAGELNNVWQPPSKLLPLLETAGD